MQLLWVQERCSSEEDLFNPSFLSSFLYSIYHESIQGLADAVAVFHLLVELAVATAPISFPECRTNSNQLSNQKLVFKSIYDLKFQKIFSYSYTKDFFPKQKSTEDCKNAMCLCGMGKKLSWKESSLIFISICFKKSFEFLIESQMLFCSCQRKGFFKKFYKKGLFSNTYFPI